MWILADSQINIINSYVQEGKYDDAIWYINGFLENDPTNDEFLLMIADIQYKKWEIGKASKAIDFLNDQADHKDPMGLYVKWVLEMEKNHRKQAREFLLKAMETLDKDNHEIMRCYGLSEYRYGNREKWLQQIEYAHDLHIFDAEIIYNLIELYLLEKKYRKAQGLITFFHKHKEDLEIYDKTLVFYESKIKLFSAYLNAYAHKKA
jgi:tetratricopeptide (TPR) repeat protein